MLLILSSDWSSHNTYSHNIVRDALVVVAGHWTWAVLSSILAASVLGMASVQVSVGTISQHHHHPIIQDITVTGD